MTRDQERSLWLGRALAEKLTRDPDVVLSKARQNLIKLRTLHPRGQAAQWLAEWSNVLGGPIDGIVDVLTADNTRAQDLRQNSPFAGVLTPSERRAVLSSFAEVAR